MKTRWFFLLALAIGGGVVSLAAQPDKSSPAERAALDWGPLPPQPGEDSWHFVEELKAPLWTRHPWDAKRPGPQQVDLSGGVQLKPGFADPKGRLPTAYEDLRRFLAAGGVPSDKGNYTIETAAADLAGEAFRLEIGSTLCRVVAGDVEGIRRGIFQLEDEMLRVRGAFLPLGKIERTPIVTRRISRCFFGPIKRMPKMRDELMDEMDYYPDEYLNRLAHEGVNGLWLTAQFSDLCATQFTPQAGQQAERRLAKLRRTVASCLRYGIRTYIFCIEPRAWDADNPLPEEFPELAGSPARAAGKRCFCPSSETAAQYLYDSVNTIFKAVPDLGGMINISHGERPTTCLSALTAAGEGTIVCSRCSTKAPWEILHASLSAMERGMHAAAPAAELISWLYMPQGKIPMRDDLADWVYQLPAHTPKGVILQFNFESGVRRTVFGKELVGGDYWLSTPGPSSRFERVATTAYEHQTRVSAKIQTSNSHEVATTPYVPVPSSLFHKFSAMRRLGVATTMLCWYFGNYPGPMNKAAADLLSFEPFPVNEDAFLHHLAALYWSERDVPAVIEAWKLFSQAYENYPLSILFQYYGPMHNGPVWPLLLKPRDAPLSPTWQLGSSANGQPWPPSGDRVGECIVESLTLAEVVELARRMSGEWDQGISILNDLEARYRDEPERISDIGVARALGIQFRSGYNILRFYLLREEMLRMEGRERLASLKQLGDIVREELALDAQLLALCEKDSRLGFHSEAEGYMYFPAKIRWRMQQLQNVLASDVPEFERTIREEKPLFPEYTGKQPGGAVAECVAADSSLWGNPGNSLPTNLRWQPCDYGADGARVRWAASYDADALYIVVAGVSTNPSTQALSIANIAVKIEPRRLWPSKRFVFNAGPEPPGLGLRVVKGSGAWIMRIPLAQIGMGPGDLHSVRVDVRVLENRGDATTWRPSNPLIYRLELGTDNPADLGWLVFIPFTAGHGR